MKYFKFTTDTETFIIEAKDKNTAIETVIDDRFREKLDDELSDLFDVEEVASPEQDETIETQIDDYRELQIHSHMRG